MKKWLLALLAGIFALSLAIVSDTGAAKAGEKFTYNGYYSENGFDVKVTDPKGKEIKIGDTFAEGTTLTFKITLRDLYEWTGEMSAYVVDGYYEFDEDGIFECTPSGDVWVYAYPSTGVRCGGIRNRTDRMRIRRRGLYGQCNSP